MPTVVNTYRLKLWGFLLFRYLSVFIIAIRGLITNSEFYYLYFILFKGQILILAGLLAVRA
jgi:hypothetical protein